MDPNKPIGLSNDKPGGLSNDNPTGLSNDKPTGLSNDNQNSPTDLGNPTENLGSLSGDANPLTGGGSNPQSGEAKPNDFSGTESGSVNPEMPQPLNTSAQTPTAMPMGDPIPPAGGNNSGLPNAAGVNKAGGSSHKMLIGIIILLVVAILGVGGYYFYTTQTGSKEEMTQNQTTSQTEQDLTGLETELESVQVTDPEGDLMEVDKEITLLEATPAGTTSPDR